MTGAVRVFLMLGLMLVVFAGLVIFHELYLAVAAVWLGGLLMLARMGEAPGAHS